MQTVGGRYALEQTLGRAGRVFRARHLQLGKMFALEVVAPAFAGDEDSRRRFQQEARRASELSHPGLVPVVDFGAKPATAKAEAEGEPVDPLGEPRREFECAAVVAHAAETGHGHDPGAGE